MFQPGPWHDRLVTSFAALHDLTGKVAVVTGGSRGIGRAIVQTLAEAGADVVIASRKLDACEAAAEQVRASTGRRAVAIACHVGRWGDCDRLIAETLARAGGLDVLVNNAGMSPLYPSLDAVSEELFDKTLAVNLKGPFRLAVLAATHMAAVKGDGEVGGCSIINIGTTASLTASVGELPYACAKAGLNALTVGLAEAYAPTVRVNAILPGPFRTDISGVGTARGRRGPVRAAGADGGSGGAGALALHLASAASSYTTRRSSGWTAASPARCDRALSGRIRVDLALALRT
jgi:NAD(P)-dependent dehydrogenase (short-subunit alcohol dehydrogenase family)